MPDSTIFTGKKIIALFFLFLAFSFFSVPVASADGLVPCGGSSDPCTLCHLIIGISNLTTWGLKILATAALVAVAIAGVMYVVSSGSETMMSQAKGFLSASLIGFAVVLGAWLIVYTTMNILSVYGDLGIGKAGASGSSGSFSFSCNTTSSALDNSSSSTSASSGDPTKLAECNKWCNDNKATGGSDEVEKYNADCLNGCSSQFGVGGTGETKSLAECNKWCTSNKADNSTAAGEKYNADCLNGCANQFVTKSGSGTGEKLSQSAAQSQLDSCGVKYASSSTLNNIQDSTVSELCNYKSASGCSPMITNNGGTTGSHATTGSCNHSSGCKADLRLDSCNNNYIESNYTSKGTRSDGAKMYQSSSGACYAKESDHWDISLKSCPPGR